MGTTDAECRSAYQEKTSALLPEGPTEHNMQVHPSTQQLEAAAERISAEKSQTNLMWGAFLRNCLPMAGVVVLGKLGLFWARPKYFDLLSVSHLSNEFSAHMNRMVSSESSSLVCCRSST